VVDYRVFLPVPPLPETGLEPWAGTTWRALGVLAELAAFR